MNKRSFLSLNISIGKYTDFVNEIVILAKKKQSSYVCIANVHMLVEAYNEKEFASLVNNADLVTPDGMPLAVGMKVFSGKAQDRVAGMDLLPDLLTEAQGKNIPVFFYGGTTPMLDKTRDYVQENYPGINVCGTFSPPFRPLEKTEEDEIVQMINASGAGMVFVVLGCPKQERWMASMKNRINACMLGVGGALPVLIGMQKRAPEWMQRGSLEWLYRLRQEPKRLFKRYFFTNTTFIRLFLRAYLLIILKKLGVYRGAVHHV